MKKVHLISVTEPLIYDMAIAIHDKGYEVSVSGVGLTETIIDKLNEIGCTCYGNGWYPDKLMKNIQFVVSGAFVSKDNPELLRAKELGLLTLSMPEFIFDRTKSKTRVVVAGSLGKSSVIAMIAYALQQQNLVFDYALLNKVAMLPSLVSFGYEARIALIEGDDRMTSTTEKRFQLEFYRPHIAVITNLNWANKKDHDTPDEYKETYKDFVGSIEKGGKLIFCDEDKTLRALAENVREDITSMPYETHSLEEKNGNQLLCTRYGDYPIWVADDYFLLNLNAARLTCRQLGIKDSDFYQAISDYSFSLKK